MMPLASLLGREPGPIFIFAGLLGLAQGLDQILDLAQSLGDETPGRFVLVGEGPVREHLQDRIERERIARVRLVPAQPRERIPALLAAADVAIITLGMSIPGMVPSKIYEAMATSLPILLVADGEPARRVEEASCGLAVPPGDLATLAGRVPRTRQSAGASRAIGAAGRSPRNRSTTAIESPSVSIISCPNSFRVEPSAMTLQAETETDRILREYERRAKGNSRRLLLAVASGQSVQLSRPAAGIARRSRTIRNGSARCRAESWRSAAATGNGSAILRSSERGETISRRSNSIPAAPLSLKNDSPAPIFASAMPPACPGMIPRSTLSRNQRCSRRFSMRQREQRWPRRCFAC